jgi:(p)ppGpp synthase/HD superfamily hydrolase
MASQWSQEVYLLAWNFASHAHKGQTYGGPQPGQSVEYINHIASVAMELMWALERTEGLQANLAIQCALLHDVLEDTPISYTEIESRFGREVAEGVQALTKNESLPSKREQMLDSLARIKRQPLEVWMVKLADRITNLSEPPAYWDKKKRAYYREEADLILEQLGEANPHLAARLAQKITHYQQYV